MTLKELKELVAEYQEIQPEIRKIKIANNLSKNEKDLILEPYILRSHELKEKISKHKKVFEVSAKVFNEKIKEVFLSEGAGYKDANLQVSWQENVTHSESFEGYSEIRLYDVNVYLITKKKNIDCQTLFSFRNDTTVLTLDFDVNLLELLANPKLENGKLIYEACWKAIEESLKPKVNIKIKGKDKARKLLVEKLEILTNETKRNIAIKHLNQQIEELAQESATLQSSLDDFKID